MDFSGDILVPRRVIVLRIPINPIFRGKKKRVKTFHELPTKVSTSKPTVHLVEVAEGKLDIFFCGKTIKIEKKREKWPKNSWRDILWVVVSNIFISWRDFWFESSFFLFKFVFFVRECYFWPISQNLLYIFF